MKWFCSAALLVVFLCGPASFADSENKDANKKPSAPPPMNEYTRLAILRGLAAERVYVRKPFPRGKKGLALSATGRVTPDEGPLNQLILQQGCAAKPGDLAVITRIEFTDRSIIFEINGGPKKPGHWYQHLQIGVNGGMTSAPGNPTENALGSSVALEFPKYVPELSVRELKSLLRPVFDFNSHSSAEAYADALPPKIRDAIKAHTVLVGMDHDMVTAALGKPQTKIREKDENGLDYEEWIFGQPPQDVQFVRFGGDQVVRLEIMKVDGTKVVRTEPEVDLRARPVQAGGQPESPAEAPPGPPSLRRPGEAPIDAPAQQPRQVPGQPQQNPAPGTVPDPNAPSSPAPGTAPIPPPGGPN